MRYKITCSHCGQPFMIDTEGNRIVRCACPTCGEMLRVQLGEINASGNTYVNVNGVSSKIKPIWIIAVLFLLIGGGVLWYYLDKDHKEYLMSVEQKQARRKAHRDSLMRIRAAQEEQVQNQEKTEKQQKEICEFLKTFYAEAVLGEENRNGYLRYFTSHARERFCERTQSDSLSAAHGFMDTESSSIDWNSFYPRRMVLEDADIERLIKNLKVISDNNDWYKVRLVHQGTTEYVYIKVMTQGGRILIDDCRR